MLNNIVFAGDGTAYGTFEFGGRPAKVAGSNAIVWRSNDHGHNLPRHGAHPLGLGHAHLEQRLSGRGHAGRAPARRDRGFSRRGDPHLHCSARKHVTWVRDEIVIPHHHARTYTARGNDLNHAIACQTRLVDGTIVRSAATFVTP